jgi:hypothetical protein
MSLQARIHADMTQALRELKAAGDAGRLRLDALRVLAAEIKNAEIAARGELDDEGVLAVVTREVKKRRETADEAAKGGREDLSAQECAKADALAVYLPEQLTDDELAALVDEAVTATGATTPKEMGKVMGWLAPRIKGRADGKTASRLVTERLAAGD